MKLTSTSATAGAVERGVEVESPPREYGYMPGYYPPLRLRFTSTIGVLPSPVLGRCSSFSCGALLVAGAALLGLVVEPAKSTSTSATRVQVVLTEYRITLSRTTVPPGRVVFEVVNRGRLRHDFSLASVGRGTRLLDRGQRATLTVTLTRRGLHRFRSTPRGEAAVGMQGHVRVGGGPAPPRSVGSTVPPFSLTQVAAGLGSLTHVAAPPGDHERLKAVEKEGVVRLLKNGALQETPFLDIRDRVHTSSENGLLALAFAPDYAESGLFYAAYNDSPGTLSLVELRRSHGDPDIADAGSERTLLVISKPTTTHNGGMLQFGPDGYLYMSVGDGGSPPEAPIGVSGQRLSDPLGSILRIDPRGDDLYAIPSDNPFLERPDARPEIVAYGLRNPWRFWIDAKTRTMLIGDAGEKAREELDKLSLDRLGVNFGWPCREGTITPAFAPGDCEGPFVPPVYEYEYRSGSFCSVVGGVVVRDRRLPRLDGLFLFSDFCNGGIRAIHPEAATPHLFVFGRAVRMPTTFGVDGLGRVHVGTLAGDVYRVDPPGGG
jgi:glucose/arabinose dehydrogenase